MLNILIVTDSGAVIPDRAAMGAAHVSVALNRVSLGERTGYEGTDFPHRELWDILRTRPGHLRFSPPTPQEYYRLFQAASAQFDGVLSVHGSSRMSSSYANAQKAAERLAGSFPVGLVDSRSMSAAQGLVVQAAAAAAQHAPSFDALVRHARAVAGRTFAIYYVESTETLLANAMLSEEHSLLAGMLGVKPLLTFDDGVLVTTGKARTRAQLIDQLLEFASGFDAIEHVVISQPETAQRTETTRLLLSRLGDVTTQTPTVCSYSPSLAALIGASAGGLIVTSAQKEPPDAYKN
ncbi:MAG: DegV family protein [Anaerolineae bacterium]|jgi:DegV family protein with EDD domain|nr:DegV family protein [Anaerolineae bacterium]